MRHRHAWTVTRRIRCGGQPLIRRCTKCGETQRDRANRWVITVPGKR